MTDDVAATRQPRAPQINVSEIFGPVIQGEGLLIGQPTVFVRTGGCDFRCSWCDTLYAVLPEYRVTWTPMLPVVVADSVDALAGDRPITVTLSGGNPAIQHPLAMRALCDLLHERGHRIAIETQGTVTPNWIHVVDDLTISPKPPSSGNVTAISDMGDMLIAWSGGPERGRRWCVKVVVFDDADMAYAEQVFDHARRFFFPNPLLVAQAGNPDVASATSEGDVVGNILRGYRWLSEATLARGWYDVRVLPQLHALAYGNRRGV